jgi:hypothetical protein
MTNFRIPSLLLIVVQITNNARKHTTFCFMAKYTYKVEIQGDTMKKPPVVS